MVENRLVDALWMDSVGGLSKLVRIAQQYKVVCRACYGENICEGHLPGLVDHEVIELGGEAGSGKEPRGTRDDRNLIRR
jgi:hypothetical protein